MHSHTSTVHPFLALALATVLASTLAACSGGSGDDPLPSKDPSLSLLTLTDANFRDYGVLLNRALATEVEAIRAAYHQPSDDSMRLVQSIFWRPEAADLIQKHLLNSLPTSDGVHACAQGGTLERTRTDSNNDGQINLAGEQEQLTFNACSNGTMKTNGTLRYRLISAAPALEVALEYESLNSELLGVGQGTIYRVQGNKKLTILSSDGLQVSSQASTPFSLTTESATSPITTTLQTDYVSRYAETGAGTSTQTWSAEINGSMNLQINADSADLVFTTPTPFSGQLSDTPDLEPSKGNQDVMWNGTQKLSTTSDSKGLLTLSFDRDNNGTVDATYMRNWAHLTIPN
jgi:hypothetical protein